MVYNATNKEKVATKVCIKAKTIKKVSDRQTKIKHLYSILRKQFLKDYPNCGVCGKEANQIHHKLGRIAGRMTDTSEWLSVCFDCHHEIEMRPEWAKKNGYSKNRLDK
jgi:serine/threonine-protein kinase RIO1